MVLEPTTSQECTLATLEVGRARCDAMSSFRVPYGKKLLAEPGIQVLGKRPCILNDEEKAAVRVSTRPILPHDQFAGVEVCNPPGHAQPDCKSGPGAMSSLVALGTGKRLCILDDEEKVTIRARNARSSLLSHGYFAGTNISPNLG